jgi:hypothetical protein
MPNSLSTNPTNGWDVVYAIRFSDVNAAIAASWTAANSTMPKIFNWSGDVSGTQQTITGAFDPWQLAVPKSSDPIGSSGANVVMLLVLRKLVFTQAGTMPTDVNVRVQVTLSFIGPGSTKQLITTAGSNAFTILDVSLPDGTPLGFLAKATLNPALTQWLETNLVDFDHVFHTVDFEEKLAGDAKADASGAGLAWMTPTTVAYGVYQPPLVNGIATATLETSIFGVMAMTEGRSNPSPNSNVDPYAIPPNDRAGLLISTELFLDKFVRAALPSLFSGATAAQFGFDNDKNFTNTTDLSFGPMTITDADGSGGKQVNPDIPANGFTLGVNGTEMQMQLKNFHWEWNKGIDVYTTYNSYAQLSLGSSGAFAWATDRSDKPTGVITESLGVHLEEIFVPIAGAIVGAAIGAGAGPAAKWLGGKLASCFATQAVEDGVEFSTSRLPSISGSVSGDAATREAAQDIAAADAAPFPGATPPPLGWCGKLQGLIARNWGKVLCGAIGTAAGGGIGAIPKINNALATNDEDKIPKLQPLLDNLSLKMQWPNADRPQITSAQLSNCLQIGVKI